MTDINVDMNNPEFQRDFFNLEKQAQSTLIKTLKKISKIQWEQLYQGSSLNWEAILSKQSNTGTKLYSFRFSKKFRAIAVREEAFLRLLTLHTDHDSAYQ